MLSKLFNDFHSMLLSSLVLCTPKSEIKEDLVYLFCIYLIYFIEQSLNVVQSTDI